MIVLHPYYERYDFNVWMKDDMLHLLPRVHFRSGVDVTRVLAMFVRHFSYRYDGIVYVDLPYDEMKQRFESRFAERPESRRKSREPVYERSFTQTELLKEVLLAQSDVPVLCISGVAPIEENVVSVERFIRDTVISE